MLVGVQVTPALCPVSLLALTAKGSKTNVCLGLLRILPFAAHFSLLPCPALLLRNSTKPHWQSQPGSPQGHGGGRWLSTSWPRKGNNSGVRLPLTSAPSARRAPLTTVRYSHYGLNAHDRPHPCAVHGSCSGPEAVAVCLLATCAAYQAPSARFHRDTTLRKCACAALLRAANRTAALAALQHVPPIDGDTPGVMRSINTSRILHTILLAASCTAQIQTTQHSLQTPER